MTSEAYKYAVYGWVHPGNFAPTVLIGVKTEHMIAIVKNGKAA